MSEQMRNSLSFGVQVQQRHGRSEKLYKVDLRANVTDDLLEFIEQRGGEILFKSTQFEAVQASVSSKLMGSLSQREDVYSISTPAIASKSKVDVSEGVVSHRIDQLRQLHPTIDGKGIKIGVLSDSATYLSQVQATGDLPSVTILDDVTGTGEGTAMLEIINDMAPGADLYFATAYRSDASFAQNIISLANAGCKVIVDDVFYFNEPAFEDGIIAQAVNQVASQGVAYFSSAGNDGNIYSNHGQTWEGDYNGNNVKVTLRGDTYLDYHFFSTSNPYNQINGAPLYASLQWADNFNSGSSDYDLFIVNSRNQIVSASTTFGKSYEFVQIPTGSGYKIMVARYSGTARFMRVVVYGAGTLQFSTNGATSGHATAEGAFGVGAIRQTAPLSFWGTVQNGSQLVPEYFTSDGPRRIFFENGVAVTPGNFLSTGGKLRAKPDFSAADGVSTSTPGFNPFYGTSAAAPHAAALAALAFSATTIDLSTLRTVLSQSTIDVGAPGFDDASGAGVLDAILLFNNLSPYLSQCLSNPCLNDGSCSNSNTSPFFTCTCQPGFSGSKCGTNINDCASNPCKNGATCIDGINSFTCSCPSGFSGLICGLIGPGCSSNTCQNGGTCTEGLLSISCTCQPGFSGSKCETNINDCAPNPCKNGATCIDGINSFTCSCPNGYSGQTCQTVIDQCASNPCQNSATCTSQVGTFTCKCLAGFLGPLCADKDMCITYPCFNGGTCKNLFTSYSCTCAPGFSGPNCLTKVTTTPCSSNPCQNGGTCTNNGNSYTCQCPPYFLDENCQTGPYVYTITAKTNPKGGSGTNGAIQMRVNGCKRQTALQSVKTGIIAGDTFVWQKKMIDISPMTGISVILDSDNDWTFDYIKVEYNDKVYWFNQTTTVGGAQPTSKTLLL